MRIRALLILDPIGQSLSRASAYIFWSESVKSPQNERLSANFQRVTLTQEIGGYSRSYHKHTHSHCQTEVIVRERKVLQSRFLQSSWEIIKREDWGEIVCVASSCHCCGAPRLDTLVRFVKSVSTAARLGERSPCQPLPPHPTLPWPDLPYRPCGASTQCNAHLTWPRSNGLGQFTLLIKGSLFESFSMGYVLRRQT